MRLRFARSGDRTTLVSNDHTGPLRVQKSLYPEGDQICHAVIIHPPGGIAAGDDLQIDVDVGVDSHALLTTPAATKWYKGDRWATQRIGLRVQAGGCLEWLPCENIFFQNLQARSRLQILLEDSARMIGWELNMLGRIASGEIWKDGKIDSTIAVRRSNGSLLWTEHAALSDNSPLLDSVHGLNGFRCYGTLWCVTNQDFTSVAESLAETAPFTDTIRAGITQPLVDLLIYRAVAKQIEPLRALMIEVRHQLRRVSLGAAGRPLRIWST